MNDFKTVHDYSETADVRITLSLDNYEVKNLKEFMRLFGDSCMTADIEIHTGYEINLFGKIKKIEIEKEAFEELDES